MLSHPLFRRAWTLLFILISAAALLFGLSTALASAAPAASYQTPNGISTPPADSTVAGIVIVGGTAAHPDFLRYELSFFQEFNPAADWIVFAEGDQQVISGTLAVWDTTVGRNVGAPVFPDGAYRLRLRVVRQDFNYDEFFVTNIIISNDEPTPTPTITPTVTLDPSQATPTVSGEATAVLPQPDILPSLTPFPTPSPQATPETAASNPVSESAEEERLGVAERLNQLDFSRIGLAVRMGVTITGYIFAALAIYLILRAIMRRIWLIITDNRGE